MQGINQSHVTDEEKKGDAYLEGGVAYLERPIQALHQGRRDAVAHLSVSRVPRHIQLSQVPGCGVSALPRFQAVFSSRKFRKLGLLALA